MKECDHSSVPAVENTERNARPPMGAFHSESTPPPKVTATGPP